MCLSSRSYLRALSTRQRVREKLMGRTGKGDAIGALTGVVDYTIANPILLI